MQIERQGLHTEPLTRRHPEVRGGTCEFCGLIDQNVEATQQYKLCQHYRGMQLQCSYCPAEKDPDEIIRHSVMNVYDHPEKQGKLIVVCDAYDCVNKHRNRFRVSA